MVYQPPAGARDLLPLDVDQKLWIEERLQQVFQAWGYHRIITSTLERLETLMAGGAIQQPAVIQLQDLEEQVLGLRPELTASIARTAATRISPDFDPQRLYYNANIFRRAQRGTHNRQQEFYQSGVELLGRDGLLADVEILLLVADCLDKLGLQRWHLILGEAGLTRSLLAPFPASLRDQVRVAVARLDRVTIENLPLDPEQRRHALFMADWRGAPQSVLSQASRLPLTGPQQQTVNYLKTLIELLQEHLPTTIGSWVLDLSLIQTFDYYTGIVFEIVDEAGQNVLCQGGRYDHLLGLYHPQQQSRSGIGFSFNIEALHQALLPTAQLPNQIAPSHWLVVPMSLAACGEALAYAKQLRSHPHQRVELFLPEQSGFSEGEMAWVERVRCWARGRQIRQIAWIKPGSMVDTETLAIDRA